MVIIVALFGYMGSVIGVPNMINTMMRTAHDLLLNTVFYLMGMCADRCIKQGAGQFWCS